MKKIILSIISTLLLFFFIGANHTFASYELIKIKAKLEKSYKWKKYVSQFEELIPKLSDKKLSLLGERLAVIDLNDRKLIKYKDFLTYLNLRVAYEHKKRSLQIKEGDKIVVHYIGILEDGTKFDSSYDRNQPLLFTVGSGQMIVGFDTGVVGMKAGEKKVLRLEPKDAYGEYDPEKKQIVTKSSLTSFVDAGFELKVGVKLPTQMGKLEIIEVTDDSVTLDANHPLAGKVLIFEVEVMEINK